MKLFHTSNKLPSLNLIQTSNFFFLPLFLFFIQSILSSCERSNDVDIKAANFQKEVSALQEIFIENDFTSTNLLQILLKEGLHLTDFDFNSFQKREIEGVDNAYVILIPHKHNDNIGLSAYQHDGDFGGPSLTIVKKNLIETFDFYNNSNTNVLYNNDLNTIGFEKKLIDNSIDASNLKEKGCGQQVADCINDAYNNRSWLSVWAYVQSAILWQTAAAIAGSCAVINCVCSCQNGAGATGSY